MTPLPKVPTHMDTDNTYTSANANSEVAVNDNHGMDGIAISAGDSVKITGLLATRTAGRPSKSKTCTCCATFVMNVTKML